MTITELAATPTTDRGFTGDNLMDAPTGPGVYVLLRRGRVVMIDGAPNLRHELATHQRGDHGARTASATHYRTQETALTDVGSRREQLIEDYRRSHNSNVPLGNRA